MTSLHLYASKAYPGYYGVATEPTMEIALTALPPVAFDTLVKERDAFVRLFDPEGMNVVTAMSRAINAVDGKS